jgi:hypothetical protein
MYIQLARWRNNLRSGATASGGGTASAKPPDRQVVVRIFVEIQSSSGSAGWRCAAGGRGLLVLQDVGSI